MPRSSPVRRWLLFVVALGVGWVGCTIDDPQVNAVGAISLLTVDPAIVPQSVVLAPAGSVPSNRVQTMLWSITRADLTINDFPDPAYDLLFKPGEAALADCQGIDSPSRITTHFGTCVENLVVEAASAFAGARATLTLDFTVQVKRVKPITLPFIGDEDMDGIINGNDNCLLVANPGQEDSGSLGVGDACRVVDFFNGVQLDSDGDGVPDGADNCVHRANLDQANPPTPGEFSMVESRISDGIGLACEDNGMNTTLYKEQVIEETVTDLELFFDFILPNAQGFVVVDFNDELVFPNCDWDMGTCGIVESAIQACIRTNAFDVLSGCS